MGVPKRDTNIASPYKAIKFERNMSWMSCIWIYWCALLFLKVWWSKHSKLVTLLGTVVIFSAPSELVSARWHHRSPKSHTWSAGAELFDAIRVLGQAISTYVDEDCTWDFKINYKFIDGGWPFLTYLVPFSRAHSYPQINEIHLHTSPQPPPELWCSWGALAI